MKLINSKADLILQAPGLEGIYKQIEMCGRTCYKSEDKITEDSAMDFVGRMIKSNHTAMLEHGTVYLMVKSIADKELDKRIARHQKWTIDGVRDDLHTNPPYDGNEKNWWADDADYIAKEMFVKYYDNPYSKATVVLAKHEIDTSNGIIITPTGGYPEINNGKGKLLSIFNVVIISTNLRVLVENDWLDDLKYLCEPTEYHEKRYTIRFTTDRGVSHELVRHRVFSFAQESTRYCNYNKDKFGGEITFIKPSWFKENQLPVDLKVAQDSSVNGAVFYERPYKAYFVGVDADGFDWYKEDFFIHSCQVAEQCYLLMLKEGATPQESRQVLPNALKTEICMTGFESDWKHFFDLRYYGKTGKPHPDMQELAGKALEEFKEAGLLEKVINTSN